LDPALPLFIPLPYRPYSLQGWFTQTPPEAEAVGLSIQRPIGLPSPAPTGAS
jgi:hypothetical protein